MRLLLITLLLIFAAGVYAQSDSISKPTKLYNLKLETTENKIIHSYVVGTNDSVLYYSDTRNRISNLTTTTDYAAFPKIESITVVRNGAVGRNGLIGLTAGFAIGFLVGVSEGDDPPEQWFIRMSAGQKGFFLGLLSGCVGGVIGIITGLTQKRKFRIEGNHANFLRFNDFIKKKSVIKQAAY